MLQDKYLNTETVLNLNGVVTINFTINNSIPESKAADRFRILFKSYSPLPVHNIQVSAAQVNEHIAKITWKVAGETDVLNYIVEKSADGKDFSAMEEVAASGKQTYHMNDLQLQAGNNYYRVKATDKAGNIRYSNIAVLKTGKSAYNVFSVYPNPVRNGQINIQFLNVTKGTYQVMLYNNMGQVLLQQPVNHNGISASYLVPLGNLLPGVYSMEIKGKEKMFTQQVVIQ